MFTMRSACCVYVKRCFDGFALTCRPFTGFIKVIFYGNGYCIVLGLCVYSYSFYLFSATTVCYEIFLSQITLKLKFLYNVIVDS